MSRILNQRRTNKLTKKKEEEEEEKSIEILFACLKCQKFIDLSE